MTTNEWIIENYPKGRQEMGFTCKYLRMFKDFYSFHWTLVFELNGKETRVLGEKF